LVVGLLGGSSGTTRDTFELLSQGEKAGARVALFGRKLLVGVVVNGQPLVNRDNPVSL